jgi:hypothetical protein
MASFIAATSLLRATCLPPSHLLPCAIVSPAPRLSFVTTDPRSAERLKSHLSTHDREHLIPRDHFPMASDVSVDGGPYQLAVPPE